MQFPGYWVTEDNGKVVIHTTIFDETELDPATDWKEAWQNQDADSPAKGFVEAGKATAHAARLIARNQGRDISDVEILALQSAPSIFRKGSCELGSLDDLRQLCTVINTVGEMQPAKDDKSTPALPGEVAEIPFK